MLSTSAPTCWGSRLMQVMQENGLSSQLVAGMSGGFQTSAEVDIGGENHAQHFVPHFRGSRDLDAEGSGISVAFIRG